MVAIKLDKNLILPVYIVVRFKKAREFIKYSDAVKLLTLFNNKNKVGQFIYTTTELEGSYYDIKQKTSRKIISCSVFVYIELGCVYQKAPPFPKSDNCNTLTGYFEIKQWQQTIPHRFCSLWLDYALLSL